MVRVDSLVLFLILVKWLAIYCFYYVKDWRVLGGVGVWRCRKGEYRSREEDIYIKGSILGLVRDLALKGIPGVHGDVPR